MENLLRRCLREQKNFCLFCRGVSEQVEAKKLLDLLAMFLYTYYC